MCSNEDPTQPKTNKFIKKKKKKGAGVNAVLLRGAETAADRAVGNDAWQSTRDESRRDPARESGT